MTTLVERVNDAPQAQISWNKNATRDKKQQCFPLFRNNTANGTPMMQITWAFYSRAAGFCRGWLTRLHEHGVGPPNPYAATVLDSLQP